MIREPLVSPMQEETSAQIPRFDAAHVIPHPLAPTPAVASVSARSGERNTCSAVAGARENALELYLDAPETENREEQLQLQSVQIAAHLQSQLRQLDQRQAQLNAQAAEVDNAMRKARLWLQERETDLRERELALNRRDQRFISLEESERRLREQAANLEAEQAGLAREHQVWSENSAKERERLAEQARLSTEEQRETAARLQARETALDKERTALDELRCEVAALHRQSLEMRLIAEQLWGQVAGRMAPTELTQSVAKLRLKLSEQYRLELQMLVDQKRDLAAAAAKLNQQHQTLKLKRDEMQNWLAAREAEIEFQAGELLRREAELAQRRHAAR